MGEKCPQPVGHLQGQAPSRQPVAPVTNQGAEGFIQKGADVVTSDRYKDRSASCTLCVQNLVSQADNPKKNEGIAYNLDS